MAVMVKDSSEGNQTVELLQTARIYSDKLETHPISWIIDSLGY